MTKECFILVGDLILFKNNFGVRFIYEVVGIHLGALHQDSVAELRPINFSSSCKGNQLINPQFLETGIRLGLFIMLDRGAVN